jgi:hypothetical protein
MYRDADKQREANRAHAKAYRMRKGMTQGMTGKVPERIIPDKYLLKSTDVVPERKYGVIKTEPVAHHPTCKCYRCKPPKE